MNFIEKLNEAVEEKSESGVCGTGYQSGINSLGDDRVRI